MAGFLEPMAKCLRRFTEMKHFWYGRYGDKTNRRGGRNSTVASLPEETRYEAQFNEFV